MDEATANVEIANPMYGGDDFEEETAAAENLNTQTFALDVDDKVSDSGRIPILEPAILIYSFLQQSTNFTNPMYVYQQGLEEEKRTLLVNGNGNGGHESGDHHSKESSSTPATNKKSHPLA